MRGVLTNRQSRESSRRTPLLRLTHAWRKGVDLLSNFVARGGQGGPQHTAFNSPAAIGLVEAETPASALPPFEAWLHAYRTRLEQVCGGANSVVIPAGKTSR
jgi:hypothetical protein